MKLEVILLTATVVASCVTAGAADWPRFRGESGTGVSQTSLPVSWTPSANVAWKKALPGAGVSSPIVVGEKVFVTCYSGYGLDRSEPGKIENLMRHLVCFDLRSGETLWQKDIPARMPEDPYTGIGVTAHGYASHTPTSDGEKVYVYFGKSGAYAFDLDGNQLWQRVIGTESDPWKWGSSSSPIVYENLVIVTASAESQAIVGLDKETGEEVWRQEAAGLDGMWGTPTLVQVGDRTELVLSVPKEIWGLDPATGKLHWYSQATGAEQTHSSPIATGGNVYAFTGRGGGSVAVKAGGSGDVTQSHQLWTGRDSARFGSPVGYGSRIYLVASGVLTAVDAKTGEKVMQARLRGGSSGGGGGFGGSDYGSPVIADGKLFYVKGNGEAFVFSLGDELVQLSINLLTTDKETFGGSPAIADGRLLVRSNKHLYCVTNMTEVAPNASAELIDSSGEAEQRPGGPGGRGFGGNRGAGGPPSGGRGFGGNRGGRGGPGGGRGGPGQGEEREDNRPERPQRPKLSS